MIAALRFGAARQDGGCAVRPALFALRPTLPLSAASIVANGVRENLAQLLGRECEVELLEPIVPGVEERRVLVGGALVWRARGRRADGFVILRPAEAANLAALAFGETLRSPAAPLSELERETLSRLLRGLAPLCASLCGTLGPAGPERAEAAAAEIAVYFEVRTLAPPHAAIGFGVSVDPPEETAAPLTLADLSELEFRGSVRFATGTLAVPQFARLARGTVVPFETPLDAPSSLIVGGIPLVRGTAGASSGSGAFAVGEPGAA